MLFFQRIPGGLSPGEQDAGLEYRVAGVRQEHGIPFTAQCHGQMAAALLRAVAAHHAVRGHLDTVTLQIVIRYGLRELGHVAQSIFPGGGIRSTLNECIPDMLGRLKVGRSDTHVPDRAAFSFKRQFFLIQAGEYFIAESIHTLCKFHGIRTPLLDLVKSSIRKHSTIAKGLQAKTMKCTKAK